MTKSLPACLVAALLLGTAAPAVAQTDVAALPSAGVLDIVDEVRVGLAFHGVYYTLIPQDFGDWDYSRLEDVTFDVLFTSPDLDAFRWIGAPRPEVGATINLEGEDSLVHAGLTWQAHLFDSPVFVEGTFGAAIHNGYLGDDAPDGRRKFGCRVNFYERIGLGVDLTENATATLAYEHSSNAELCDYNAGISNLSLKFGWKF
ncbi:acyloxyacyl hydrolase [Devosia sp. 1566]|uniref:acyloxyacyl hydrolase n=1 Tax=Devosia sp. 1566 TaxID=2499144 RepID=UPI000FDA581B|nr:acyloxyacyl hydrolase [Devosia sp. 1566]